MVRTGSKSGATHLRSALDQLLPARRTPTRRATPFPPPPIIFSPERLDAIATDVESAEATRYLDAPAIKALLTRAVDEQPRRNPSAARLIRALRRHCYRRWTELAGPLAQAVADFGGAGLLEALPKLRSDEALIRAVTEHIGGAHPWLRDYVEESLAVKSRAHGRILLTALLDLDAAYDGERNSTARGIVVRLAAVIGRGLGWTAWARLMLILIAMPKYADPRSSTTVTARDTESREAMAARHVLAEVLGADHGARVLAGRILDLAPGRQRSGTLLSRPAEVRAAFVSRLAAEVEGDDDMRQAVIEALLWLPHQYGTDLAQYAAARLVRPSDREFLTELRAHPDNMVGYAADAVGQAAFGETIDADVPTIGRTGVFESLRRMQAIPEIPDEAPKTWIGDRLVEQMIEQAIARVESEAGGEYADHGEEGEESLLTALFERLADRFEALDHAFAAATRATAAPRRVALRYRRVDKAEEGKPGLRGAKRFSTDLCLIVDPVMDGVHLGKRASILQAKRLYRYQDQFPKLRWHHSFHLDIEQMEELLQQTHSSFYLFQGPTTAGRGLPVLPTLLVRDLAAAQGGAGAELARDTVAVASRTFADWMTYDLLALRVGDPWHALVAKAEGGPGRRSRPLLDLPRIELEISISPADKEEGR